MVDSHVAVDVAVGILRDLGTCLEIRYAGRQSRRCFPTRSIAIKGPGLRIDIDVRRVWRCPSCGQTQKLPSSATSARCGCTREGVALRLTEESRSPRLCLRAEIRSVIDRLLAGEQFSRLTAMPRLPSGDDVPFGDGVVANGSSEVRTSCEPQRDQENDRPLEPPSREVQPAEEAPPGPTSGESVATPPASETFAEDATGPNR
jgi:hypothetical protein